MELNTIYNEDCLEGMKRIPDASVDSVVTDPPYGLGFMGKAWDSPETIAFKQDVWREALRVLKPGGYLLAFGGSRTYHRITCAIEDAGFEIRDCIMWIYGSGFPKAKSCLKPAYEPIVVARKPGPKMLPLNIDSCRVETDEINTSEPYEYVGDNGNSMGKASKRLRVSGVGTTNVLGRWPANVMHDGSEEVLNGFPQTKSGGGIRRPKNSDLFHKGSGELRANGKSWESNEGPAARFFYCAKASKADRGEGNNHPTVKPLALMRYLVRLVTPENGIVLDPFGGSGTTAVAAIQEGRHFIGFEKEEKYFQIAQERIAQAKQTLFAAL